MNNKENLLVYGQFLGIWCLRIMLFLKKQANKKLRREELQSSRWKLKVSRYKNCSCWLLLNSYSPVRGSSGVLTPAIFSLCPLSLASLLWAPSSDHLGTCQKMYPLPPSSPKAQFQTGAGEDALKQNSSFGWSSALNTITAKLTLGADSEKMNYHLNSGPHMSNYGGRGGRWTVSYNLFCL